MGRGLSILKRIKSELGEILPDPVEEAVRDVRDEAADVTRTTRRAGSGLLRGARRVAEAIDEEAPALTRAYRAGLRLTPGAPLADALAPKEQARGPLDAALRPLREAEKLGHGAVLEPLSFAARELLTEEGGGRPFSGEERRGLGEAAKRIDNPFLRAGAKGALQAADIATNPLTYVPPARIPGLLKGVSDPTARRFLETAMDVGPNLAGLGGIGAGSALTRGLRVTALSGVQAAGAELGGEAAEAVGAPRGVGALTGSLVLPAGITAARGRLAAPVLSAQAAGAAGTGAGTAGARQGVLPGMKPPSVAQQQQSLFGVGKSAADLARQAMLSGDVSQIGRIGVIGGLQALSSGRPVAGMIGLGRALRGAFDPRYADEYLVGTKAKSWEGLAFPARGVQPEFSGVISRLPVLGHLERAMFQRFTPILASETAQAMLDGLRREVVTPRGVLVKGAGDFRRMSRAEAKGVIGRWVHQSLIGKEMDPNTTGAVQRAVLNFSLLSPRWTRGQLASVAALANPGPEGELARRFWTTTAFMALATSVGVTALATGDDPRELLNPFSDKSLVDPRNGRRFLAVDLGPRFGNVTVSPFQPVTPLVRSLLRPLTEGVEAAREERTLLGAVEAFVRAGGVEARDAARDYLLGRASPPLRLFDDLIVRNADFAGNPIMTAPGLAGVLQGVRYAGTQVAPIAGQPFVEGTPRIPGTEPSRFQQAVEFGSNITGLTVRTPDRLPDAVAGALRGEIARRGETPSTTDSGLFRQFGGLNLDADERARFYRDNPQVRAYLDERARMQGEKFQTPQGRVAVDKYRAEQAVLKDGRDAALTRLERDLKEGRITGDEYRRQRGDLYSRYRAHLEGAQQVIFGSTDPDRVQAALDAVFANDREGGAVQQALDGLYAIEMDESTPEGRDRFFAARQEYLDSLPPDIRQRMMEKQIAEAPTETEAAYLRLQPVAAEFFAIPTYRGATVEESRAVSSLLGAARDYQQMQPGMELRTAIMRVGRGVPARIRNLARRSLGGRLSNSRIKNRFMRDNPELSRFYSSVPSEIVEEMLLSRG